MPGIALPTPAATAPGLADFINGVAKQSGLDPRVVEAWVTVEGAYNANGTGHFNYLNLRPAAGDVGVVGESTGKFDLFSNVNDAITSTVNRIKQPFASGIVASAGKSPATQLSAIANSAWSSDHYTVGGVRGEGLILSFEGQFGKDALGSAAQSNPVSGVGSPGGPSTGTGRVVPSLTGWLGDLETWLTNTGKLVLAYVVLVGVAGALFVTGLKGLGVPIPKAAPVPV